MLIKLYLPNLQVLGFHVHSMFSSQSSHQGPRVSQVGDTFFYVPSDYVPILAAALPSLQHFEAFCVSTRRVSKGVLHCGFMSSKSFPCLRGITCHCARFVLRLTDLSASYYAVVEASTTH